MCEDRSCQRSTLRVTVQRKLPTDRTQTLLFLNLFSQERSREALPRPRGVLENEADVFRPICKRRPTSTVLAQQDDRDTLQVASIFNLKGSGKMNPAILVPSTATDSVQGGPIPSSLSLSPSLSLTSTHLNIGPAWLCVISHHFPTTPSQFTDMQMKLKKIEVSHTYAVKLVQQLR